MARMGEKRRATRIRRRIKVVFDHDPHRKAQTTNLSATGVGVASDFVAIPGTVVSGTIMLPQDRPVPFQAKIRWARKAKGRSALDNTNTMGLEFVVQPAAVYEEFLNEVIDQTRPRSGGTEPAHTEPIPAAPAPRPEPAATPRPSAAPPRATGARARATGPRASARSKPAARPRPAEKREPTPARETRRTDPITGPIRLIASGKPEQKAVRWQTSPVGQVGRVVATVGPEDMATSSERFPGGLSPVRAAEWLEDASARCLVPLLPAGLVSAVVGLSLTVTHRPPVRIGTRVRATAKLTRVTAQGRTLSFDLFISDGERELVAGTLARILIDRSLSGEYEIAKPAPSR